MSLEMAFLFFLSTLACFCLLVEGARRYLGTRNDALARRIEDLQERALGAGAESHSTGDFWDFLLQSTYGVVFGKSWFREKELDLIRAGIRGHYAVKVYGVLSLVFTGLLLGAAYAALGNGGLSMLLLGLAAALVLGYFVPEQVLVSLKKRHRLSLMAALPDTTDMLSIVLGAGLSLDQAIARVSE